MKRACARCELTAFETASRDPSPGARRARVAIAMRGHVLSSDALTASYGR